MSPRITEGPPFSSYRPISITSVLPRVFERLVSVCVERFMNTVVSNHQVCLSQRPGYLWCTFVRVPYTAKYIGEWAGS